MGGAMKRTAVMLDGGFVRKRLKTLLQHDPSADEIRALGLSLVQSDEELFRIYYYDCVPELESVKNPLSGKTIKLRMYKDSRRLLEKLCRAENVAFRRGELMYKGWRLKDTVTEELIKAQANSSARSLVPDDLTIDFSQKAVDMKIGLDVAWLSSKRIVDRLILVTADTDFIPAMKFARREGVQIVYAPLKFTRVNPGLYEHADLVRDVDVARLATSS